MSILKNELEAILQKKFPNSEIELIDTAGDQDHYNLTIKDSSFKNISIIAQHKLVKDALKEVLSTRLHALSIKTIALD